MQTQSVTITVIILFLAAGLYPDQAIALVGYARLIVLAIRTALGDNKDFLEAGVPLAVIIIIVLIAIALFNSLATAMKSKKS